jgi:hypothetical protein
VGDLDPEPVGVGRLAEPGTDPGDNPRLVEMLRHILDREEVNLDEIAELRADLIFLARDDGGVRNR